MPHNGASLCSSDGVKKLWEPCTSAQVLVLRRDTQSFTRLKQPPWVGALSTCTREGSLFQPRTQGRLGKDQETLCFMA